ncbi:putative pre-mRNA cleavage complex subunit Clp1, clp1 domain superfamily protein [Helianthus anomalus]
MCGPSGGKSEIALILTLFNYFRGNNVKSGGQLIMHLVVALIAERQGVTCTNRPFNIAGFIWITDIDILRKKITYLAPSGGELPSKFLLMGSLTWIET